MSESLNKPPNCRRKYPKTKRILKDLVRKMNDEKYMELMDMPLTELVDEHIILLQKLKTMREGIENILKTHHFPFIISGMKMELKGLVE